MASTITFPYVRTVNFILRQSDNVIFNVGSNKMKTNNKHLASLCFDVIFQFGYVELTQASNITADPAVD